MYGSTSEEINLSSLLGEGEETLEKYPIVDIDKFYRELYNYYIERGYYTIITKLIGRNIFQFISIFFYFVITLCINWEVVFFNEKKVLFELPTYRGFWYYFIIFSMIILSLQLLGNIIYSIQYGLYMRKISYFYNKIFCIEDSSLTFLKWSDIEFQIVNMKNNDKFPYIRKSIESLSIVKRINRRKNYLILLLRSNYLKNYYISNELIDYLNFFLIQFNEAYLLDRQYLESKKLYFWLKFISIVNVLLIPFKFLHVIILFILMNAESLYTKRDIIGNRHWQETEFYLYNEYTHLFKNRMNKASYYMNLWIIKNPNSVIDSILTFIISVSSCIVSLFTPIILFNSTLSDYRIHGNTIIWYLACFSSLIILSRKYLLNDQTKVLSHNKLKEKVEFYSCSDQLKHEEQLEPLKYKNDQVFNTNLTKLKIKYKEYLQLYSYTIVIFLKNVWSIFTLPFILNKLANSYLLIGNYMIRSTQNTIDGDMVEYSDFENIDVLRELGNKEEIVEKENTIEMKRSLKLYIMRNQEWYNNYKKNLKEKYGNEILYDIEIFNKKINKKDVKINEEQKKDSPKYNREEDSDLLNSNLFHSENKIDDTSTVITINEI